MTFFNDKKFCSLLFYWDIYLNTWTNKAKSMSRLITLLVSDNMFFGILGDPTRKINLIIKYQCQIENSYTDISRFPFILIDSCLF